jgi:hypothetical protein
MAVDADKNDLKKLIHDFGGADIKLELLTEDEIKKITPLHNLPSRNDYSLIGNYDLLSFGIIIK